jgi:hypothetical protein
MVHKWKKIGVVGVDSGRLMLVDPSYIDSELPKYEKLVGLEKSKQVRKTTDKTSQIKFKLGHAGAGVVFDSGLGDGEYTVYADIEKVGRWGKRVTAVKVEMVTPKEVKLMEAVEKRQMRGN